MTRALSLNLVPRPSPWRMVGTLLLVASLAAAGWEGLTYMQLSEQLEQQRALARKAGNRRAVPVRPEAETKAALEQQEAELRYANRIINQLALPWDRLFTEVETSIGDQVTLLSIEPDMSTNTLQITAEAQDLDAMLAYAKRLRTSEVFKDAHLKSHQIQADVAGKPVRFVVNAKWTVVDTAKGISATKKY